MNTTLIPFFAVVTFAAGSAFALYLQNTKVKFTFLKPRLTPLVAIRGGDDTPSKFEKAA